MSVTKNRVLEQVGLAVEIGAFVALAISWWALNAVRDRQRVTVQETKAFYERDEQIRTHQASLASAIHQSELVDTRVRDQLLPFDGTVNELRGELNVISYLARDEQEEARQIELLTSHAQWKVPRAEVGRLHGILSELQSVLDKQTGEAAMTLSNLQSVESRNQAEVRDVAELVQNSSVPQTPVYNVVIEPSGSNRLTDNLKSTIRFFIGQSHINGGVPFPKWTVSPDILKMPDTVALTVTMKCIPCGTHDFQEKIVTYSAEKGASSEAVFEIVPIRELARQADGQSQIVFDVATDGIEYDHIVMDVYVSSPGEAAAIASAASNTSLTVAGAISVGGAPFGEPAGSRKADIVFQIFRDPAKLRVRIQPILPELKALFKGKVLENGEPRDLVTGLLSEGAIQADTNIAYVALRSLVEPENEALQNLLNGSPGGVPDVGRSMNFSSTERDTILKVFFRVGAGFYAKIFSDESSEDDLTEVMTLFEGFSRTHKRLRVQIVTNNITVPWQLLHPPSDQIDVNQFWGFRYELTVVPFLTEGGAPRPLLDYSGPDSAVFAGYHLDDYFGTAYIVQNAKQERDLVSNTLHHPIRYYDNAPEFLKSLDEHRDSIQLVLAYTHATSGTIDFTPKKGGPVFVQDGDGPRILFSPTESAKPKDIYDLNSTHKVNLSHKAFFTAHPLVFFNACETATLGFNPLGAKDTTGTTAGFPETMLRLGARGVIGTESRVWAPFALAFGNNLLQKVLGGEDVPSALLDVRLAFDSPPYNNPLGLLYSYYGNPDLKIIVRPNGVH